MRALGLLVSLVSAADTGIGFASPGFSLGFSPGFSEPFVPVVSAGSSPALAAATVGLMELSLDGESGLGAVGWSVADGVGSPDDLATTRRARDLLPAVEEPGACLAFFFPELF